MEEEDEATGGKKEKQEKKKTLDLKLFKLAQICQSIRAKNIRKEMATTFDTQDELQVVAQLIILA